MHPEILAYVKSHGLSAAEAMEVERLVEVVARGLRPPDMPEFSPAREPASLGSCPDARSPDVERAPRIAGRYQDLGLLGAGGMGEVRRVLDTKLNRTLAMKILHGDLCTQPSTLSRFMDEAQATAQLQHPNIVPVHDIGHLADGRVWFTMLEVQGRTLGDAIRESRSRRRSQTSPRGWTFRRLVAALLSVCRALAYAHDRGVVHRDLKPDNVMVGETGEVYVLDWGLAKIVGRPDLPAQDGDLDVDVVRTARPEEHLTDAGRVVGTAAYMPPEQAPWGGRSHRRAQRCVRPWRAALPHPLRAGPLPGLRT